MADTSSSIERKQAVRLRRYLLAAASYVIVLALLWTGYALGFIHGGPAVAITAVSVAANAALYTAFRTNLNLRFADPSLTKFQVYLGITLIMWALYHAEVGRGISLGLCFVVLLFGIFRLSTRELIVAALYTLAAYALIINLLMHLRPEAVQSVHQEWFNWVLLAASLPWFGVVGGRIRALRDGLKQRNRELEEAVATIHAMATRDEVTGLYNRAFFTESLNHALAQAERHERGLALLFFDADRFKHINDTLGHPAGDRVLREVSRRIAGCVRGSDIVARLGGDEFVALIEDVRSPDAVQEIAHKILEAVARPFTLERRELPLSVSIGIALAPADGRDAESLMRAADVAMYRAKAHGRGCFRFYTRQMSEHAEEQLALEAELQHALERGQLRLLFQPKLLVADGIIRGAEALLRWQHPRLGLLLPERFINLAEDTGAIVAIGSWVLKQACARAARWCERHGRYSVAVNLSARQFADPGLLDTIDAALAESGLDPALLDLEITESMVMRDPEAAAGIMNRLRSRGVRISMDDFGTGYSSLGYLKRFPINTVKLDRSFVRDLPHHPDDVAIARAVLAMAASLRMDVTAEGVERADQLDFLRREGCLSYQGYYCSRPVPEDELLVLLEAHAREGRRVAVAL